MDPKQEPKSEPLEDAFSQQLSLSPPFFDSPFINDLAYAGQWESLFSFLEQHPHLVNRASDDERYTPIHQAAWYGASIPLMARLLRFGADPNLKTSKGENAREIAMRKHPQDTELAEFLGFVSKLSVFPTVSQVLRATFPNLDHRAENRATILRLVSFFGPTPSPPSSSSLISLILQTLTNINGVIHDNNFDIKLKESFNKLVKVPFCRGVEDLCFSDLFCAEPPQWGLRGDAPLWTEMKQLFYNTPLPTTNEQIASSLTSAFFIITHEQLYREIKGEGGEEGSVLYVPRFDEGGMSAGDVCKRFWGEKAIPLLQKRAKWLRILWSR